MVQTVAMYHSLIPRIIYGNLSTQEALQACEQEFFQDEGLLEADIDEEYSEEERNEEVKTVDIPQVAPADLNIHDVMEEETRLLEDRKES